MWVATELQKEGVVLRSLEQDWLLFQVSPLVRIDCIDPFSAEPVILVELSSSSVLGSSSTPTLIRDRCELYIRRWYQETASTLSDNPIYDEVATN